MPIITFKCEVCGKEKEEIVPMRRVADGENLFMDCKYCEDGIMEQVPSVPSPMVWGCRKGF